MNPDRNPFDRDDDDEFRPLSSPYGPQYDGVDESAGGADSSPFEDVPSGEKAEAADNRPETIGEGE